jgi:hypothetical protein
MSIRGLYQRGMNLRDAGGMVPLRTNDIERPWRLVPFPDKEKFASLFPKVGRGPGIDIERYWAVLTKRATGASLVETAKEFGITKERVRQMEAKFLRKAASSLGTD